MIYALAVSVAFSTMALVTLALVELAQGLRRRAQRQRFKALDVALRLHAELGRELEGLLASHMPPPRVSRISGRTCSDLRARPCGIDSLWDRSVHRIQCLRDRLERINVQVDDADERHLERLHRTLLELATDVELLAAEIGAQAVVRDHEQALPPAARRTRDDRRVA